MRNKLNFVQSVNEKRTRQNLSPTFFVVKLKVARKKSQFFLVRHGKMCMPIGLIIV